MQRGQFFRGIAGDGFEVLVPEQVFSVLIEEIEDARDGLDQMLAEVALALDAGLVALALGDVGIGRHHAAAGQGRADDLDHRAVGPGPFQAMRQEFLRQFDPLAHLRLDVARTILAALGVIADDVLKGRIRPDEVIGEAEQFGETAVGGEYVQVGIDHADALVHVLQDGAQQRGLLQKACFRLDLLGDVAARAVVAEEVASFIEARLALGLDPAQAGLDAKRVADAEGLVRVQCGAMRRPFLLRAHRGQSPSGSGRCCDRNRRRHPCAPCRRNRRSDARDPAPSTIPMKHSLRCGSAPRCGAGLRSCGGRARRRFPSIGPA